MKKKALKFIAVVSGFISACAVLALICTYLKEIKNKFRGIKGAGEFVLGEVSGAVSTEAGKGRKPRRRRKFFSGVIFGVCWKLIKKLVRIILKRVFHIPFI